MSHLSEKKNTYKKNQSINKYVQTYTLTLDCYPLKRLNANSFMFGLSETVCLAINGINGLKMLNCAL